MTDYQRQSESGCNYRLNSQFADCMSSHSLKYLPIRRHSVSQIQNVTKRRLITSRRRIHFGGPLKAMTINNNGWNVRRLGQNFHNRMNSIENCYKLFFICLSEHTSRSAAEFLQQKYKRPIRVGTNDRFRVAIGIVDSLGDRSETDRGLNVTCQSRRIIRHKNMAPSEPCH